MKNSRPVYVFDSYAFLAYLENETGSGIQVRQILEEARAERCVVWACILNIGEVAYIIEREQRLPATHKAIALIDRLQIHVVDADRDLMFKAAHIKAAHPVSYADAFVAALALTVKGSIVTGDPEFKSLPHEIPVLWLKPKPKRLSK